MKIIYELNLPKIVKQDHFDFLHINMEMEELVKRASVLNGFVDGIHAEVNSLLILVGDEPSDCSAGSELKPSDVLKMLHGKKYDRIVDLNLSVPNKIKNKSSIKRKIEAEPYAFITQSIVSLSDLGEIVDIAKPFDIKVVACVMVPSKKNKLSADMIGIDWKEYENNPIDFILHAGKMANEVLLTSPNSFRSGLDLIKELKK